MRLCPGRGSVVSGCTSSCALEVLTPTNRCACVVASTASTPTLEDCCRVLEDNDHRAPPPRPAVAERRDPAAHRTYRPQGWAPSAAGAAAPGAGLPRRAPGRGGGPPGPRALGGRPCDAESRT